MSARSREREDRGRRAHPIGTVHQRPALWIALSLGVLACASKGDPSASQLRFVDSDIWEKELQKSMTDELPTITVAFAGTDATVSNMPDRLEKWLYVINERDDGHVEFRPDTSFLVPKAIPYGLAFSLGMAAWNYYQGWAHYAMSRQYNAIVLYHPSEGYLTRVVFVRKPEGS